MPIDGGSARYESQNFIPMGQIPCLDSGFWFILDFMMFEGFDAADRACAESPYALPVAIIASILYLVIFVITWGILIGGLFIVIYFVAVVVFFASEFFFGKFDRHNE